ncbi:MAG: c-type cytochrome [Chthoniobacterales bacterium]
MAEPRVEGHDDCMVQKWVVLFLCLLCLCSIGCNSRSNRRPPQDNTLAIGRRVYLEQCATCHGKTGQGLDGKVPRLSGAPFVTGAPTRLAALVVDGLRGRQTVGGAVYRGVMPAWRGALTNREIAAVLSYIRRAWGNNEPAVSSQLVSRVSDRFQARRSFWTAEELRAVPDEDEARPRKRNSG